jgi:cytochrome c oxidase cbb3-type subunit 3
LERNAKRKCRKVASYILSLKISNPKDPKAPEGEVWVDDNTTVVK